MTSPTPAPWWTQWNGSLFEDQYGPLLGGHNVESGLENTLRAWMPAYIFEVNRQLGGDVLQIPKDYRFRPEFRAVAPSPGVAILVVVPGTIGEPERTNSGYRATWSAEISIAIQGGQDWQETEALGHAYGAVVRAILVQHPSLGGVAETTTWKSEKYLEGEHVGTRTFGLEVVNFHVTMAQVLQPFGGPAKNSIAPPPPLPEVEEVNLTVENTQ